MEVAAPQVIDYYSAIIAIHFIIHLILITAPVKAILQKFGSGKEEDKMAGYPYSFFLAND